MKQNLSIFISVLLLCAIIFGFVTKTYSFAIQTESNELNTLEASATKESDDTTQINLGEAETTAKSMIVIETTNGTTLYAKNENEKLPMASTTKIVTALTVIENCEDLDKTVIIPKVATTVEGSSIYLKPEEELTIRQLLYGLMLQSGNDSALTLALEVGGTVEHFAELMNETAKKCGAINSNFVTPHGLDDKDHYTTAQDLANITAHALKNPTFKEIVSTKSYNIPATNKYGARYLINKNKLLSGLQGCVGVKTGYTSRAGRCLVTACERNGMQVVCVVLNCRPMFEESAELINKAFDEYTLNEILPPYKFVTGIQVENGKATTLRLYNKQGYSVVAKNKDLENYVVVYDYPQTVKAPIEKDKVLGTVKVYFNKTLLFTENLCSIERVDSLDTNDKIKNILDKW